MAVEPLAGKRQVKITDRRTSTSTPCRVSVGFAHSLKSVSEETYPNAAKMVLVTDNLNTNKTLCLYEAFEPEEAYRLAQRFEWQRHDKS